MAIDKLSIQGYPGLNYIQSSELMHVQVITVTKEGRGYDLVSTEPGNRQAKHTPSTGKVEFDETFIGEFVFSGSRPQLVPLQTINITYSR